MIYRPMCTFCVFPVALIILNIRQGKSFNLTNTLQACRPEDGYVRCFPMTNYCVARRLIRNFYHGSCPDNTDETRDPLRCTDDEIRCSPLDQCLPRNYVRWGDHCPRDRIVLPCRPEEFVCRITRRCIRRWQVMDGRVDCSTLRNNDTSDEEANLSSCTEAEFACVPNNRCIPREWVRDGVYDCVGGNDEAEFFEECLPETEFKCTDGGRCIPRYRVLDGFPDCQDRSDEMTPLQCILDIEFLCESSGRCIPRSWRLNNVVDCLNGSDELSLSFNETCLEDEFFCHNRRRCLPNNLLCDGIDHCGDCSDEIENCAEPRMYRCPNDPTGVCVHWDHSCNSFENCPNGKDDITSITGFKCLRDIDKYCVIPQFSLHDNLLACNDGSDLCFTNGTFNCDYCLDGVTIISPQQICDGVVDCPDLSDECLCSDEISQTNDRVRDLCKNVCYGLSSERCSSCSKGEIFCEEDNQCLNSNQVCDGHIDCPLSNLDEDEDVCTKMTSNATLQVKVKDFTCDKVPQNYLQVFQLIEAFDLFSSFVVENATRCDGVMECPFFEDECSERANCSSKPTLCDEIRLTPFDPNRLINTLPIDLTFTSDDIIELRQCERDLEILTGFSICNGIQECESGKDENNCTSRFSCNAGFIDWPLFTGRKPIVSIEKKQVCDSQINCINDLDELNCPPEAHFYCEDKMPLFIPRSKVRDGFADCSDQSDECPDSFLAESAISSREFLIKSTPLNVLIWIMAIAALIGNLLVSGTTIKKRIKDSKKAAFARKNSVVAINELLIINLSVADFLMGVVLCVIINRSLLFSGQYCLNDKPWRTGTACNAIGVLTVLSSEASVFTIVCLSTYRLYSVFSLKINPSKRMLLLWIFLIWASALVISLIPLVPSLSSYMITDMWISGSNPYFSRDRISLNELTRFTQRIIGLNKTSSGIVDIPHSWYDLERFLSQAFPHQAPVPRGYFGYYSASAVCLPRFYKTEGDTANINALPPVIITLNFVALMYIGAVYIAIYYRRRSSIRRVNTNSNQVRAQLTKTQRNITILIGTDVGCWLPICIMTFISLAGIALPPTAYAVSAIVLLPINSSLNPIIYSDAVPYTLKKVKNSFLILFSIFRKISFSSQDVSVQA